MLRHLLPAVILVLALSVNGWGYEQITVTNGGSVKGRVVVTGDIPQDPTVKVTKDNSTCGDTLPREKYVISKDGGVRYAVVFIEEIKSGKSLPTEPLVIDNVKCAFVPHVQVGVKGQDMVFKNTDPMLHNTHLYLEKKTVYNLAIPITGMEIKKPIKKAGLISVECDVHSWMKGYLYMVDHPYITVTDAAGNFSLTDIPPGNYEIRIWHEALGEQEKGIAIEAGTEAEVKVEFNR